MVPEHSNQLGHKRCCELQMKRWQNAYLQMISIL